MTREEYLEKLRDPAFVKKCLMAIDSLQDRRETGENDGAWMGWKGTDLRKATVLVTSLKHRDLGPSEIREASKMLEMYYPQVDKYCKLD